jgi:hypothetical protein
MDERHSGADLVVADGFVLIAFRRPDWSVVAVMVAATARPIGTLILQERHGS